MKVTLVIDGFSDYVDLDDEANADREPDVRAERPCAGDVRFSFGPFEIRDDDGLIAYTDGVNPGLTVCAGHFNDAISLVEARTSVTRVETPTSIRVTY